jgi:large subunit ribosomal protein L25
LYNRRIIYLELLELKAKIRKTSGTKYAKNLRRNGEIPAVLYGRNTDSFLLKIDYDTIENLIKKTASSRILVNLLIQKEEGALTKPAILKELQTHPVSQSYLHADFYEIDMNRKIKAKVKVTTFGTSKGIEMGGMLNMIRHELEILCLPMDIPDAIEIDISELDIGDSVHVNDITVNDNVEIIADVNFTVIAITNVQKEKETEEEVETEEIVEENEDDKEKKEKS